MRKSWKLLRAVSDVFPCSFLPGLSWWAATLRRAPEPLLGGLGVRGGGRPPSRGRAGNCRKQWKAARS
eukprot:2066276-Alexandrium_andersonii.AAC.1